MSYRSVCSIMEEATLFEAHNDGEDTWYTDAGGEPVWELPAAATHVRVGAEVYEKCTDEADTWWKVSSSGEVVWELPVGTVEPEVEVTDSAPPQVWIMNTDAEDTWYTTPGGESIWELPEDVSHVQACGEVYQRCSDETDTWWLSTVTGAVAWELPRTVARSSSPATTSPAASPAASPALPPEPTPPSLPPPTPPPTGKGGSPLLVATAAPRVAQLANSYSSQYYPRVGRSGSITGRGTSRLVTLPPPAPPAVPPQPPTSPPPAASPRPTSARPTETTSHLLDAQRASSPLAPTKPLLSRRAQGLLPPARPASSSADRSPTSKRIRKPRKSLRRSNSAASASSRRASIMLKNLKSELGASASGLLTSLASGGGEADVSVPVPLAVDTGVAPPPPPPPLDGPAPPPTPPPPPLSGEPPAAQDKALQAQVSFKKAQAVVAIAKSAKPKLVASQKQPSRRASGVWNPAIVQAPQQDEARRNHLLAMNTEKKGVIGHKHGGAMANPLVAMAAAKEKARVEAMKRAKNKVQSVFFAKTGTQSAEEKAAKEAAAAVAATASVDAGADAERIDDVSLRRAKQFGGTGRAALLLAKRGRGRGRGRGRRK